MSFTVKNASQFKIKQLSIVTKGGLIDVTALYDELNIFDCLFLPVMSGNILITDAVGLSKAMHFDGSDVFLIEIEKSDHEGIASFKKSFRIYKQTDRRNINQSSEKYILHFISDELIFSDQQRITQSYETTYSEVAKKVLDNYLKIESSRKGIQENSLGVKKIVVPNLRPLDALDWCAKRAIDKNNSPNFLFFENIIGFNFVSLTTLLTTESILNVNFQPKNLQNKNALQDMSSAKSFEVLTQNDIIEKTRSGVNAGKFIGFDPLTRTFGQKQMTFNTHYDNIDHGNKNANATEIFNRDNSTNMTTFNSRKVVSIFGTKRKDSNYIKKNDPSSISKVEDYENFAFQRKALLSNLTTKRIKIVMPGNFQLTSGFNIDFKTPGFNLNPSDEIPDDTSISGKYLIIATRHIITNNRHETVIEVATDSTKDKNNYVSSPTQNAALKAYNK